MVKKSEWKNLPIILDAIYRPVELPEHAGNPLIEALPPFHAATDMIGQFGRFPLFSENDRELPYPSRMMAVSRLNDYLEPLTAHFDVIEKIGIVVRAGYTHRNPLDETYRKEVMRFYRESMAGKICPIGQSSPATAPSFALFGVSGVGKSTVIERTLSFLPPVIKHKNLMPQVVWMKIDCPLDGSLKQLLIRILAEFDFLLGTNYLSSVGGETIDELILSVAKLAATHHLGILLIDEIQNLLDSNGVGRAKMLNFFVTLANEVKIPVITIGTPRALSMLEGTFREARRVGDHGTIIWDSLSCNDEWTFFLDALWKYQWTKTPVQLTDGLSNLVYDCTQGIHALVVRLFQLSQLEAIRNGSERLHEDLIKRVASDRFKLVVPMLKALKDGNKKAIENYEDLLIKGLKKATAQVDFEAKTALLKAQAQTRNQESKERISTVSALVSLGYDQPTIQPIVTQLFDGQPNLTSRAAVKAILSELVGDLRDIGANEFTSPSLKEIVQAAVASGGTPVGGLTSAGYVGRSGLED